MISLTHLGLWPWLLVAGLLASLGGMALTYFFPRSWWSGPKSQLDLFKGAGAGLISSVIAGGLTNNLFIVVPVGLAVGYLASRVRPHEEPAPPPPPPQKSPAVKSGSVMRVPLQQGWDKRPRYESREGGMFVGREELLKRLAGDFTSRRSGTILISGVRGVGKTASDACSLRPRCVTVTSR